jgi:hypothetical protein
MSCAVCGQPGVDTGDVHLCRLDGDDSRAALGPPPSSGWRVMSGVVLAVTVAYVVACAVKIGLLVHDYNVVDLLTTSTGTVTKEQLDRLARWERTVSVIQELLVLGYIVGFIAWFVMIRKVVLRNGFDPITVLLHWTVIAWLASIAVSVVLAFTTSTPPVISPGDLDASRQTLLSFDRDQIIFTIVRILVASLLITAVLILRKRVRTTVFGALEAVATAR